MRKRSWRKDIPELANKNKDFAYINGLNEKSSGPLVYYVQNLI